MLFALLVRLEPHARLGSAEHEARERRLADQIKTCAGVSWVSSYGVLGPYDFLEIFEAPDEVAAAKVSAIFRAVEREARTETWTLIPLKGETGARFGQALDEATRG